MYRFFFFMQLSCYWYFLWFVQVILVAL